MLIGGYSTLFLLNHGLSISDISFLKSFQALVIILVQVPIGFIIDRYRQRYLFVLISIFLAAIWLFLTGIGSSPIVFYSAEFFNGLSLAIFNAVMLPILVETYTHESGKDDYNSTLGKFFKYQNLFMILSVIIGSVFVNITSRSIWIISSMLLFSIACFSILSDDLKKFDFLPADEMQRKVGAHFIHMMTRVKADSLAILFVANIALITIFQILAQFWQIFVYDFLDREISYALVYGLFFSIILSFQAIGSYVAEKIDSLNLSLFTVVLFTISMGYLIMVSNTSSNPIISISVFSLAFFLFKYPSVIISALLHKNISNDIRSTFDATISTLSMIVSFVVFLLVGILLKKYGNNILLFSIMILSIVCTACIVYYKVIMESRGKTKSLDETVFESVI
jgi:MFS family permease